MKLAATQFAPSFKAPEQNLKTAVTLVRAAASHGAKLVVLPELCLTGYSFMSEIDARPFAEILTNPTQGSSVASMRILARELGVAIVWGLVEEDPGTHHLYNTQMLVTPSGGWISYRKGNPWGNDYLWSQPGDAPPPITTFEGKSVGLLICADVRGKSDKIEEFYEPGDADIVCFSANWGDGGFPAGKWVKFAKENRCTFVVSNRYGREANNNFGEGGICIIEPSGKVHCDGLKWNEPCVVYFDAP